MSDLKFTDYIESEGCRKLPTFQGYTVDIRLRRFRKVEMGQLPEYIEFSSQEGQALLVFLIDLILTLHP